MKRTAPSSDPLPNPRHEAFAREVASGRNATQAYLNVYGTKNRQSGPDCPTSPHRRVASTGGSRLMRRKSIVARIKAFQQAGAAGIALDLREIHDFLTRVVRTPAGDILPSSDLCTRVKHTRDGTTDVWMPNKLACLRLSAKLQGFLDTARTPKSDPPEQAQRELPPVLTEERRAILIAQRRAAIEEYQKQSNDQRPTREESPPEQPSAVAEHRPTESQNPDNQKPRQEPRHGETSTARWGQTRNPSRAKRDSRSN
jgi:hypothetical protein